MLKPVEERYLYSCTANIRVPEITVDMEVRLNLKVIEKLSKQNEKERFLKDVWSEFSGENQPELSHVKEKLWLEVRITIIILK